MRHAYREIALAMGAVLAVSGCLLLNACGPRMPSGETHVLVLADGVSLDGEVMEDLEARVRIRVSHLQGKSDLKVTVELDQGVRYRRLASALGDLAADDGLESRVLVQTSKGSEVVFALDTPWVYLTGVGDLAVSIGGHPMTPLPMTELQPFAATLLSDNPSSSFVVATDEAQPLDDVARTLKQAGAGRLILLR